MLLLGLGLIALAACVSHRRGVQVADTWTPVVANAVYPRGMGPVVLVDAAHGNWHTVQGRFRPFAQLLEQDGYRIRGSEQPISAKLLGAADVFVISNAVKGGEKAEWRLPTPPALEPEETQALVEWVRKGGSLLLIADHMPFPGSVSDLAEAFGFTFFNGFAKKSLEGSGTLIFPRSSGALADHPISRGRTEAEGVAFVKSFTGQAFRPAPAAQALMIMPDDWQVFLPQEAWEFSAQTPTVSTQGLMQGAVLKFGEGRLAVFGEAAMFTAQAVSRDDGSVVHVGMSDPEAVHNQQFVLNVLHWLSGLIPDAAG